MSNLAHPRKPINRQLANLCRIATLNSDRKIRVIETGHEVEAKFVGDRAALDLTVEVIVDGVANKFVAVNGKWYLK